MKLIVVRFAIMAALSACLSVNGEHTDNEKMDVARTCLLRAMAIHARGLRYRESNDGAYPDTWRGFLGQCNQEWSLAEKQAAFDLYLRAMSTNNCTTMTPMDQNLARTAVVQCELLDYTNAIPHLMALVLNSKGIHKTMAINYILKASPVSEHVTDFVETMSILSDTNTLPVFIGYFTSVTNQLLSSGQPLPWINFGGGVD